MKEGPVQDSPVSWLREWYDRAREGLTILGPIAGPVLIVTHLPVLMLETLVCQVAHWRLGFFPTSLTPKRPTADVAIAVGLNTNPYSVWPMGLFLRSVFGYRILFIQTPLEGNVVPSKKIVSMNRRFLAQQTGKRALYSIGFSNGGFDLIWLLSDLLAKDPTCDVRVLYTVNTPLRGSALARVIKVSGAREMDVGSQNLPRTWRAIESLEERGLFIHHNSSFIDLVARKSDTRPPRPQGTTVPTRFHRYVLWPLRRLLTLGHWSPPLPTWWSHTLPQIGHKATLNPFVWLVLGLRIRSHLNR